MGKRPRYSDDEDADVDETVRRDLLTTEQEQEDEIEEEQEEDQEDIEEEELQDGDEEDDGEHLRKRKKEKRNPFLDVEATVDQDEEEEEEEGYEEEEGAGEAFIEGGEDEAIDAMDLYQQILSKERAKSSISEGLSGDGVDDVEAEAARLRARFGRRRGLAQGEGEDGEAEGGRSSMRLPRVTDPKLWLVKCRPGRERDVVFHAMRHLLSGANAQSLDETGVLSVLSRDHVKGYVYMEAYNMAAVQSLLTRLSGQLVYRGSKVVRVPLGEMCDVLRVQRKQAPVQIGDWVRVRRGKYGGDIARVLDVDAAAETARIQLVPRLAPPSSEPGSSAATSSAGKASHAASRPPRRKFNVKEVATWSRQVSKRGAYWVFQGDYFHDGFLEKDIRWTGLETSSGPPLSEPITPSLEDWQLFGNPNDGNPLHAANNNLKSGDGFSVGDRVRVKRGEWRDALGTITAIGEEDLHATLSITSTTDGSSVSVRLPLAQLRRFFQTGDAVKVIRGMYAGKQGLVVMVADTRLTLFCPQTGEQYDVLIRDTRDAGHLDTPIPYADLKMERPQANFPSNLNQTNYLASSALPAGTPNSFSSAGPPPSTAPQMFRKRRDPLVGKSVVVISGPHKGHMGIIKDVQDTKVEVELHSNSAMVLLKRQHLQLKDGGRLDVNPDEDNSKSDADLYMKSSFLGGTTPFLGGTTPFIGGTTPFIGGKTPFMGGGATPARAFLPGSHTPFLGSGAKTPFMIGAKTPYMTGTRTPFTGSYGPIGSNAWGGAKTPAAASMMMHPGQQSFHPTSANFPPPRSPGTLYPPRSPGALYPPRSPGFGGSRSPGFGARTPTAYALKEPGVNSGSFGPPGASFGTPGTIFGQPSAYGQPPSYGPPGSMPSYGLPGQPPSFGPPGQSSFGFPHGVPPPMAPWDRLANNTGMMGHRTPTTAPTMRTPASAILQAGAKTPGAN